MSSTAKGWFIRGLSPRIELEAIKTKEREIRSWVKFCGLISGAVIASLGSFIFIFSYVF